MNAIVCGINDFLYDSKLKSVVWLQDVLDKLEANLICKSVDLRGVSFMASPGIAVVYFDSVDDVMTSAKRCDVLKSVWNGTCSSLGGEFTRHAV
jgi:hypothetical protein